MTTTTTPARRIKWTMGTSRIRSRKLFEENTVLSEPIDLNLRPVAGLKEGKALFNGQSGDGKVDSSFIIYGSAEPPEIRIAHGCLLIPAVFVFWWYWTQRAARRTMRGLLTRAGANNTHDEKGEDESVGVVATDRDVFNSWDEVVEHDRQDKSVTFVRWIKGRKGRERRRLKQVTRRTLAERDHAVSNLSTASSPVVSLADENVSAMSGNFFFDDSSSVRSVHWECIRDMGDIEMCTPTERVGSGSSDALEASIDEILANSRRHERQVTADYYSIA